MTITDFDYIATRNEIIEDAFEIVGVLEPGQQLSADMLAQGVRTLQKMVKAWSKKHLHLWSFNSSSFSTVAAQEIYTTADLSGDDDSIIGLDKAFVVQNSEDIPLRVIPWSEYQDIPDKESSGLPLVIAFKPTPSPSFYLWPSPDAAYTIKTVSVYPLKDFDSASGSGDIPATFQEALVYNLADRLFDKYPGAMNEREYISAKARMFFKEARNGDTDQETQSEVEGLFK